MVLAKLSDVGVKTMAGAAVPVPESAMVACPVATFANTVRTPLRAPVAEGVNVTLMLQLLLIASVCPAQVSASVKSPLVVMEEIVSGEIPLLVIVMLSAAD